MSNKIETLTKEEVARFPEFVDKWLKVGLCTDPADRPRAEAGIREAYRIAGLKEPKAIVWCDSPLSMAISHSLLKKGVWDSVWASVGNSVWASVRDSVWDSVRNSVRDSVGDSVRNSVWDSVWDSVWASVGNSVWASVRDSVGDSVRDSVRASVRDSVYGQHEAGWLSFYDYFNEAIGLHKQTEKLSGLIAVAYSAGWWIPCENICLVSERHNVCRVDDRGLIHCEDGPAIQYPDGFSVYGWHGVRIPAKWVTGEKPSAKEALTWENMEQRRAACEIVGWHNILREFNSRTIDKDGDPQIGELIEVDLPDVGREKFLRVQCGTKREFALPVPPEMKTALESQAWVHNVPSDVIRQLEVRT